MTAEIDDVVDHPFCGAGAEQDVAADSRDVAFVDDQCLILGSVLIQWLGDLKLDQAVAHEVDGHRLTSAESHAAGANGDHAVIADRGGGKGGIATLGKGDGTPVHYRAVPTDPINFRATERQKLMGVDPTRGCQKAADIDLTAGADDQSVRIGQPHLTRGAEGAVKPADLAPRYPIQGHR